MIFFVANDGTIINSVPSPVYQGSVGANNIYLVAPFAQNLSVSIAFKLPNGVYTTRYPMTQVQELTGIINKETGQTYNGWQFSKPNEIMQYFGTVTVQFFFYSANGGAITATSATSFVVGKGVPSILPPTPSEDVYDAIMSQLSALSQQLNNGAFAARAIYQWNPTYTYGAGEITYYPDAGEFGAFVKSKVVNNLNNPPYANGELNTDYWVEVVNFDHIAESYFTELKDFVSSASISEKNAQASAQAAEKDRQEAERQAADSAESALQSQQAQTVATEQASVAASAAAQATVLLNQTTAQAEFAKSSALTAKEQAEIAASLLEQFASYGVKINTDYSSFDELPIPGNANSIYFVPNGGESANSYDEWVWVAEKNAYEKIGTTEIDLSDYATLKNLSAEKFERVTADTALNERIDEISKQEGPQGIQGFGEYIATTSNSSSSYTIFKSNITIPFGAREPIIGDFILSANKYYKGQITAVSGTTYTVSNNASVRGAAGEDGTEGLGIWSSSTSTSTTTTSISLSSITIPSGRSVKVGDLIIANATYSYLYRVTAVSSTTATVTYIRSLRGATGAAGTAGEGIPNFKYQHNITLTGTDFYCCFTIFNSTSEAYTDQSGIKQALVELGHVSKATSLSCAGAYIDTGTIVGIYASAFILTVVYADSSSIKTITAFSAATVKDTVRSGS